MFVRIVFVFLIIVTNEKLHAQNENSLFWEVSGNGLQKSSFLFGTYHLLNSGYLESIPKVKAAFENADGAVVETELDSTAMMKMMFLMVMPDKKISDLLNEKDYALVSKEVQESTGASMDMMAQFKPTFITLLLTLAYNQKTNGDRLSKYSGHPLDSYFATAMRKKNKPVGTFETVEEQISLVFDHDPVEKQAEHLVDFVEMKDEVVALQPKLLDLYMRQDLNGLYDLYKKYENQFGEASYLSDDRNVKWMETLPAFLQKGNQFIAVGAFHFTGEKGLIKLLRDKGYNVKPLKSN